MKCKCGNIYEYPYRRCYDCRGKGEFCILSFCINEKKPSVNNYFCEHHHDVYMDKTDICDIRLWGKAVYGDKK